MFAMFAPHTHSEVRTKMFTVVGLMCAAGLSAVACGSSSSNGSGTGGAGSGVGTGGHVVATGGTTAATGGMTAATGGARASGGTTGTAGARATGTGGATAAGGKPGTGGTPATGGSTGTAQVGSIGGCQIFPADNPWNQDISGLPLNSKASTYLASMNGGTALHADWADYAAQGDYFGIPFTSGTGAAALPVNITDWPDESDPAPCATGGGMFCYPIPLTAPVENPAEDDRHVLYLDTAGAPNNCTLYELYQGQSSKSGWTAANGAIFHLGSNALRPDGWTSGDAAGLPILPGLVRFDETINKKAITHAIRFTMKATQHAYIHPATHAAGTANASLPPMGLRLRLKASFDTSKFTGPSLVIMTAMKKYGIILADNGHDWYITGESNDAWVPYMDQISTDVAKMKGSDFEAVDTGPVSTNNL